MVGTSGIIFRYHFTGVTVIATAVSMGATSPTVAAAATVTATTAAVAGAAEEGYEAATGHSLVRNST